MHEEKARLLGQHVAMQSRYLNVVLFERGDHRIYFFGLQHKITRRRNLAGNAIEINRKLFAI